MAHLTSLGRLFVGVLCALALVGCTPHQNVPNKSSGLQQPPPSASVITAEELGRRLGYSVVKAQPDAVRLARASDSLVIVARPNSEVYLNGKCIISSSGFVYRDGQMWVPASLEGQIRQAIAGGSRAGPAGRERSQGPVTGRVVLDAGHGGKDPGARAGGLIEKSLVLDVTEQTAEQLRRRGVTVMLTRQTDKFLELEERVQIANNFGADLFLAIHADYNPSPEKSGHSILLPQSGNWWARLAATLIDRALTAAGSPSRAIRVDDRGLYVLEHTTCPAVLLELGFLSNPSDAARLRDPAFRTRVAQATADGICDYLRRR